jgi:1-acyl-sn-glycerol-3-phosphate acyltransferase
MWFAHLQPGARPLDPLWRLLRAVRAAVTVVLYVSVIGPTGFLLFSAVCLCSPRDPLVRARLLHRLSARGVRAMHWWLRTLRIVDFDRTRVELRLPPGPWVVVANHPTLLDPTVMMALLESACTIIKPSVYNRRVLRPLLAGALHFEGPTLDPASVGKLIESAVQRLRDGMHLFVFPEGTRSPEGRLRRFGRMAFEIACRADVPLVSIALRCEPCYLSRETPLLRPPARLPRYHAEVLAIDLPAGADSQTLRDRVEGRYRQWVAGGMPPVTGSAGTSSGPSRSSMRAATGK